MFLRLIAIKKTQHNQQSRQTKRKRLLRALQIQLLEERNKNVSYKSQMSKKSTKLSSKMNILLKCTLFLVEESTKEIVRRAASAVGSLREGEFDIRFNPDVYSPGVKHPDSNGQDMKKQRQLVRDAADFLLTVQIPTFVSTFSNISFFDVFFKMF